MFVMSAAGELDSSKDSAYLEGVKSLREALRSKLKPPPRAQSARGIVLTAGGAELLTNAYINIKVSLSLQQSIITSIYAIYLACLAYAGGI